MIWTRTGSASCVSASVVETSIVARFGRLKETSLSVGSSGRAVGTAQPYDVAVRPSGPVAGT